MLLFWKGTFLSVSVCHSEMQLNDKSMVLFDFEHFNRKLKHPNCNYLRDFPFQLRNSWVKKHPVSQLGLSKGRFPEGQEDAPGPLAHSCLSPRDALSAARDTDIHVSETMQLHPEQVTLYPPLLINCLALDSNLWFYLVRVCCRLITSLH